MTLTATIHVPERGVHLDLTVPAGCTTAVVGPNGAGKSTLLAAVAGLIRPADARIALDDRVLAHLRDGRATTWIPPHQRRIGLLTQQPRLFPHLDILRNVAFGPLAQGVSRRAAIARAREWLERVGADDLAGARPHAISGGQAARVAIARALAAEPDLLLLDEPLAAVDAAALPVLRTVLSTVLADLTTVLVTHDVLDVMGLADRMAVVEDGRIREHGITREIITAPTSRFGAALAGVNLVPGTWAGGTLRAAGDVVLRGIATGLGQGEAAVARFRPDAVTLHIDMPECGQINRVLATVTSVEHVGGFLRVRGTGPMGGISADITPAAGFDLAISPGRSVWFTIPQAQVTIHPAASPTAQGRR